MNRSLVRSLGGVSAAVIGAWFVLSFFGVHFGLISSLLLSLALTAGLHFASRRRR